MNTLLQYDSDIPLHCGLIFCESIDSDGDGIRAIEEMIQHLENRRLQDHRQKHRNGEFKPKRSLQYRHNPWKLLHSNRIRHAVGYYDKPKDAMSIIYDIIELFEKDSIIIFCHGNETAIKVYNAIESHYRQQAQLAKSFGGYNQSNNNNVNSNSINNHDYNINNNNNNINMNGNSIDDNNEMKRNVNELFTPNFDLFCGVSDKLKDCETGTVISSNTHRSINSNISSNSDRKMDLRQITSSFGYKRKIIAASDIYNTGVSINPSIIIHYCFNLYRIDIGRDIPGVRSPPIFSDRKLCAYMRRIGRLTCKNGLSITLVKNSRHERDAFDAMMSSRFRIQYATLDRIILKRRISKQARQRKWSTDELLHNW